MELPGFALEVSHGFEIGAGLLGSVAENGVEPGSYAVVGGVPTLYVTSTDADLRAHVSILQWSAIRELWLATEMSGARWRERNGSQSAGFGTITCSTKESGVSISTKKPWISRPPSRAMSRFA